jgi:hypothetical protein
VPDPRRRLAFRGAAGKIGGHIARSLPDARNRGRRRKETPMRKTLAAGFLLLALITPAAALRAAATPQDLTATWHGYWLAPEGWVYEADLALTVDADNNVTGSIHWTLRKSPRADEQDKLGMTGIEHVRGRLLPDAGVVRMEGVALDDPNHILGMDQYRLILSDDAKILGGITGHHGDWTAQILLKRQ